MHGTDWLSDMKMMIWRWLVFAQNVTSGIHFCKKKKCASFFAKISYKPEMHGNSPSVPVHSFSFWWMCLCILPGLTKTGLRMNMMQQCLGQEVLSLPYEIPTCLYATFMYEVRVILAKIPNWPFMAQNA